MARQILHFSFLAPESACIIFIQNHAPCIFALEHVIKKLHFFIVFSIFLSASISAAPQESWPPPTAALKAVGDYAYVEQNGIVYDIPLFPDSDSFFSLGGEWRKKRVPMDHDLSLTTRSDDVVSRLHNENNANKPGDDDWEPMNLPAVENMAPKDKYFGGALYKRTFSPPASFAEKRIRLVFLGANYIADVWINGKWLGWHEGGFTSFAFDATKFIKPGENNEILVRLDSPPWVDEQEPWRRGKDADVSLRMTPYKPCDWWNYSGIYRDVYLVADNDDRIEDMAISAEPSGDGGALDIHFLATVSASKKYSIRTEIFATNINEKNIAVFDPRAIIGEKLYSVENTLDSPTGSGPAYGGRELKAFHSRHTLDFAKPWSPESPTLYVLKFSLVDERGAVVDEDIRQLGFRKVGVSQNPPRFSLNGSPRILRGNNRHDELPDAGRRQTMDDLSGVYRDLLYFKKMNCDYLRTTHYPNHPAVFVLADRMGLIAAEEIPVYWFDEDGFAMQVKRGVANQMWLEMIARDRNFSSIAFWSMGNETTGGPSEVALFKGMNADAKSIDPGRLVYHVSRSVTLWDPSIGIGDIIGLNMYFGVFDDLETKKATRRALKNVHKRFPKKPIIITEFGIGGDINDPASIARQEKVFHETIDTALEQPYVTGVAWWGMISYLGRGGGRSWGIYPFERTEPLPIADVITKKYGEMARGK